MGIDHVFDAVGDEFARGQRIEHSAVPHGDAVVNGDGVEFAGNAAGLFNFLRDDTPEFAQVHMAGHKLREAVGDGDDGFVKIAVAHAGGAPQGAGACHVAARRRGAGAVLGHDETSRVGKWQSRHCTHRWRRVCEARVYQCVRCALYGRADARAFSGL